MLEAIQVVAEPTRKKLLAVIALNLAIPAKVMAGLAEIYAFLSDSDNFYLFLTFSSVSPCYSYLYFELGTEEGELQGSSSNFWASGSREEKPFFFPSPVSSLT